MPEYPYTRDQLIAMVRAAAARYGIDPDIAVRQLRRESVNYSPYFVFGPGKSPRGAKGIAQFIPGTAARFGLSNPYDPAQALEAWGKYMTQLLGQFSGRYDLALAGYNWGENRQAFRQALASGKDIRNYSIPSETRGYVDAILGKMGSGPSGGAASGSGSPPTPDSPIKPTNFFSSFSTIMLVAFGVAVFYLISD